MINVFFHFIEKIYKLSLNLMKGSCENKLFFFIFLNSLLNATLHDPKNNFYFIKIIKQYIVTINKVI